VIYFNNEDYKNAVETFSKIDKKVQDSLKGEADYLIGMCYYNLGNYVLAAEVFIKTSYLYAGQNILVAKSQYMAGQSYEKDNKKMNAIKIYDKLLETHSGNEWVKKAEERRKELKQ
ncbi:tetratricopeptide repeat protein, partial [Candidatus Desantisbacteria bacterium]|nr:tetratricopeptide repeat protein [Candidatus Desantisbacteria bacterium]